MFQFVHVNSYSRTLSKKASHAKWTAADVVAEATRDPSAIPHIDTPQAPIHVYGKPIEQLLGALDHWAENTKDAGGKRATRKDAVCLLAGVFSVPAGTPVEDWEQIKKDAIEHLQAKYGACLHTVIEHVDEDHPHCHFYVVAEPGQAFETVHQGRAAVKEFIAQGGSKRESNNVYREAMRAYQDEYFDAVGAKNGMARIGPGRRRLTRSAWKAEQLQALAIKRQMEAADDLVREAKELAGATAVQGEALIKQASERSEGIKAQALAAAQQLKAQALADADRLREEAIQNGFEDGLGQFEQLPWWKKAAAFLSSVVRERDELREALAAEQAKSKSLGEKLSESLEKAKKYWTLGTRFQRLFRDAEPKMARLEKDLVTAEARAADADRLRRKNGDLEGRVLHLEATVEAYQEAEQQRLDAERRTAAAERRGKHRENEGETLEK